MFIKDEQQSDSDSDTEVKFNPKPEHTGDTTGYDEDGEMTVETTAQANQRMVNSTYKLTAFCPAMPEAWFTIAEADMSQRGITDDSEKFNKVLSYIAGGMQ